MKKRCLSIVILLCLIFGVLAGCSGSDTATKDKENDITTTAEKTSATEPSGLAMSDVPGMTAPGVLPIVTEPVKLTIGLAQHVLVMDYNDNFMTKMAEEETGIDLEFYLFPAGEASQKFEMMVSANQQLPDIVFMGFSDIARANYGRNGIFIPLNEYFDKYTYFYDKAKLTDEERENIRRFGTSPDGNIYAFPAYANAYGDISMFSWFINVPWLEKVGMKMPTTTDELYAVLKAFKEKDPNGNGKPDEIPLISSNGWNGNVYYLLINSFIHYNPSYLFNVENGKLSVPVITEEYREALRYIKKLVDEELLSPLTFTIDNAGLKAMVNLPDDQDTIVGMFCGSTVTLFDTSNKPFEYDGAPQIAGPKGVKWCPNRTPNYMYTTYITKDCKHPEVAFRFCDYWTDTRRSLITRYGEPGVHFMYRPDDPQAFDKEFPYGNPYNLDHESLHGSFSAVPTPWSNQNQAIWKVHFCCILPECVYSANASPNPVVTYYGEAKEKELPVSAHLSYIAGKSYFDKVGLIPKETVTRLIYTEEENLTIAEISSSIGSYIGESLALFCTGGLDIEKDWDTYVKTLKEIGLDLYLETAQAAYDRMYK